MPCEPRRARRLRELLLVEMLRIHTEVAERVEHDPRADVSGHHDRRVHVRRIDAQVGEQRFGEALHRELRRAVRRVRRAGPERRPETIHAARVDDVRRVRGDEHWQERAAPEVHAVPAHRERRVPLRAIFGDEAAATADASIVEQQVDVVGVMLVRHVVAEAQPLRLVRHVGDERRHERAGRCTLDRDGLRLFERVFRHVTRGDVATLCRELAHQLPPHPRAAARHDGAPAHEVAHGCDDSPAMHRDDRAGTARRALRGLDCGRRRQPRGRAVLCVKFPRRCSRPASRAPRLSAKGAQCGSTTVGGDVPGATKCSTSRSKQARSRRSRGRVGSRIDA